LRLGGVAKAAFFLTAVVVVVVVLAVVVVAAVVVVGRLAALSATLPPQAPAAKTNVAVAIAPRARRPPCCTFISQRYAYNRT
jgi:hypothetical protein